MTLREFRGWALFAIAAWFYILLAAHESFEPVAQETTLTITGNAFTGNTFVESHPWCFSGDVDSDVCHSRFQYLPEDPEPILVDGFLSCPSGTFIRYRNEWAICERRA